MKAHLHELGGTAPAPLIRYLKALGVHRLVAEQADPRALGAWRGDIYRLVTALDRGALEAFFLAAYAPTPLTAPWNGGSGYYPKDNQDALEAIRTGGAVRFTGYAAVLEQTRGWVSGLEERPSGDEKVALLHRCRAGWRGGAAAWLDAAVALTGDDPRYPSLLGTGGNDGRFDFTNNFMQRLVELFDPATGTARLGSERLLREALWGEPAGGLSRVTIGMYAPGSAGGYNASTGASGGALVNPWDFVLMLEGAVAFQVAVVRRLDEAGQGLPQASAPFAVRAQAGGYASADAADESPRGEQWMPLWERPAPWGDVRALLRAGRLQVGRQSATRVFDVARAIGRLGVARGVTGFERFGFVERNGKAFFAVPLGRWTVGERARAELRVLDDLEGWVDRLRARASGAELGGLTRRLSDATLAVCQPRAEGEAVSGEAWTALLRLLGDVEDALVARPKVAAELRPLPRLRPEWLEGLDVGRLEVRLAVAIASQFAPRDAKLGGIRANCVPLDPDKLTPSFALERGGASLARDPAVVWGGRDAVEALGRIVERRVMDARRAGGETFPLVSTFGVSAADVEAFVWGAVDDAEVGGLARALMAVPWREDEAGRFRRPLAAAGLRGEVSPLVGLFKLLYAPHAAWAGAEGLEGAAGLRVPLDARPLKLLRTGRVDLAVAAATQRLRASGVATRFAMGAADGRIAARLVASLAIPLRPAEVARCYRAVVKPAEVAAAARD